jgi:hypothetical protein
VEVNNTSSSADKRTALWTDEHGAAVVAVPAS